MSKAQPLSTLAPEYINQFQLRDTNEALTTPVVDPTCCPKVPPCPTKIEPECKKPCYDPCASRAVGYGWGWLGSLILWFIIFTVLFWLVFYSLKPAFVLQSDSNQVDTAKVLLASIITALILVIIIWLIKIAINRRY